MRTLIAIAIVMAFAIPAYAGRVENLSKRYNDIKAQVEFGTAEMLRIEGQLREIQWQKEQRKLVKKAQEAEIAKLNAEFEKAVTEAPDNEIK